MICAVGLERIIPNETHNLGPMQKDISDSCISKSDSENAQPRLCRDHFHVSIIRRKWLHLRFSKTLRQQHGDHQDQDRRATNASVDPAKEPGRQTSSTLFVVEGCSRSECANAFRARAKQKFVARDRPLAPAPAEMERATRQHRALRRVILLHVRVWIE